MSVLKRMQRTTQLSQKGRWHRNIEIYGKNKENIQTKTTIDGVQIGRWVNSVRQMKKKGTLSKERLMQLEEVGFDWGRNNTKP